MKTLFKISLMLMLVVAVAFGCSQKSGPEEMGAAPQQEQLQQGRAPSQKSMDSEKPMEPSDATAPKSVMAPSAPSGTEVSEIRGTVVKTENGIVIFSDAGSFLVSGQDLSSMVGRNVKATGTVEEGGERPTIRLSSITLIE